MNEQLLKDYVATYLNPKYNGNWDVVNQKFPELAGVDKQLLKDYVATYTNPNYNGDLNVINSKFPELFPGKKKDDTSSSTGNGTLALQSGETDTALERTFGKNPVTNFFGDIYRSYEAGSSKVENVDPTMNIFGKKASELDDESLKAFVDSANKLSNTPVTDEMRQYQKDVEGAGGGFVNSIIQAVKNPGIIPQLVVDSFSMMVPVTDEGVSSYALAGAAAGTGTGAGVGAAFGALGGPLAPVTSTAGAIAGGLRGLMAGMSATTEVALSYGQFLQEEAQKRGLEFNEENVRKLLEDESVVNAATNRALSRGATIALVDVVTSGFAGKALGATKAAVKGTTGKVLGTTAALGVESVGEGVGEGAAQVVSGQEVSGEEIALETLGGFGGGVFNVAVENLVGGEKVGRYKINGEEVSKNRLSKFLQTATPDQVAKTNIEISDDNETLAVAEDKRKEAVLATQIDPAVTEDADRSRLINLEKERAKLKGLDTKSAQNRVKAIDEEIDGITGKYTLEEKVSGVSYKIDGSNMDRARFVAAVDEAKNEDALNELETTDPEVQKIIETKRSQLTGKPAEEVNTDIDALRNAEQAELEGALTNADQYKVDGVIDGNKITDPAEKKIFDEIYNKYDKLITPLLEQESETKVQEVDSRSKALEELVNLIPTTDLRRPNGSIGTQGFTEENLISVARFIATETGFDIPVFDKNLGTSEVKQVIEYLKSNKDAQQKIKEYVIKDPVVVQLLPDNTYSVEDGNHRANLLNLIGVDVIPTIELNGKDRRTRIDEHDKAVEAILSQDQAKPVTINVADKYTVDEVERVKTLPIENEDGATMNLNGTKYENGGLVIPLASRNMPISELTPEKINEFVKENSGSINSDMVKVGIYKFPGRAEASIDINIVADRSRREEALAIAKELGQESIFDLDTFENVKTGSDGKNPKVLTSKEFLDIQDRLSRPAQTEVTVTPETSSNYANMTEDNEGNFVFFHVGKKGYKTIKKGTGATPVTSREESSALSKVGGLAMYYTAPEQTERQSADGAKYAVKVPKEKVYDFNTDKLNLIDEARKRHEAENPGKAFDTNSQIAYVTKVAGERGFDMVVADWAGGTRAQTTKELSPVDVEESTGNVIKKNFSNKYESNKTKGFTPVVPTRKADKLQKVYDKINEARNAEKRYDDLYSLYTDSNKYTQKEITDLINNSDLSQEIKDEYNTALESKEETRRSEKPTTLPENVEQAIENSAKTLQTSFPGVKVIVANNIKDAKKKIVDQLTPIIGQENAENVAEQMENARGQAVSYNGKPVAVIVNKEIASSNTAAHEVWHLILRDAFGRDVKKFKSFQNAISRELKKAGYTDVAEYLDNFAASYEGDAVYEEYLAELGGLLTTKGFDPKNLTAQEKSILNKIKEIINKFAKSIIGKDVFLKDAKPENILQFMIDVSDLLAKGEDVRPAIGETKAKKSKDGVDIVKQSTEAFSGKLGEMGISIGVTNPKKGKTKVTNFDVATGLNEYYTKKYGVIPPGDFSQKAVDALADYASVEMLFAMAKFGDKSGKGWYTEDYSKALDILSSIDPDINKDPKIKAITTSIIAVASNSSGVYDNLTRVIYGISEYKKTGKIPLNVGTGKGQEAIATGIDRYNKVVEKLGNDPVRVEKFMSQIDKVSELKKKLVKEFDMKSWADAKKELATDPDWNDSETLPMSVLIFGPKIGAFWSNLSGLDGTPTIDRWCIRTIYRYKGDMRAKVSSSDMKSFMTENGIEGASQSDVISLAQEHSKMFKRILSGKGEYASLPKAERNELLKPYRKGDQIWSKAQGVVNDISEGIDESVDNKAKYGRDFRTFTKNVFEKARDIVFDQTGVKLSVSDVQAILWIYEKNLFGELGVKQREDSTYSSAANSIINKVKSGPLTIEMLKSGDLKALETEKISDDGPMGDMYTFDDKQFKSGLDSRDKRSKESIEISKQVTTTKSAEGLEIQFQKQLPARVNEQINNVISEQKALGKKPLEVAREAAKYVKTTDAYKKLGDRDKAKVIGGIKRLSGMRVKVTVDDYASLKNQIRLEEKAAKGAVTDYKSSLRNLVASVRALVKAGKISTFRAGVIIGRISKTNLASPESVNKTISYVADIFDNANLAMKISRAKSLVKNAKKNIKSKIGQNPDLFNAGKILVSIDPHFIPTPMVDDYLEIMEVIGERSRVLSVKDAGELAAKMNVIINAVINDSEAGLISAEQEKIKMTPEESAEAAKSLIDQIVSDNLDTSNIIDVNDSAVARSIASITEKDMTDLLSIDKDGITDFSKIKLLLGIRENIKAGIVTHDAMLMSTAVAQNRNANQLSTVVSKITGAKLLNGVTRVIGNIKGRITGKVAPLEAVRSTPLEFIDDVLGNFNDKTMYRLTFGLLGSPKGKLDARLADLAAKADAAEKLLQSRGRTDNAVVEVKYKIMALQLQREFDSNPDSTSVAPAIEFIDATLKAISRKESSLTNNDARILQKIRKDFGVKDQDGNQTLDIKAMEDSLTENDKKAMSLIDEINSSSASEALFTSSVIRGARVNIINNYVHHAVLSKNQSLEAESLINRLLGRGANGKPSTKAGTLVERTPGAKPIMFDPVSASMRGARETLTDFYMTPAIREVTGTLNKLKDKVFDDPNSTQEQKDVAQTLVEAVEESLEVTFQNYFSSDSALESFVKVIQKLGYQTTLASIPRAFAELASNMSFAMLSNPKTTVDGLKYTKFAFSPDLLGFLEKIGSAESTRLAGNQTLTGKYAEGGFASGYGRTSKSAASSKVMDYAAFITRMTAGKIYRLADVTADLLISTPDKVVSKPYYLADFINNFEKLTGVLLTEKDLKNIAEGTSEYLSPQYESAMQKARETADSNIVRMAASNNSFNTILKNAPRKKDTAMMSAYRAINSFMSRFYLTEYGTLRSAVIALFKSGDIDKKSAVAIIAASATRMSMYLVAYSLLSSIFDSLISGGLDLEGEEEDEEDLMTKVKRSIVGTGVGVLSRRTLGNLGYTPVAFAVEQLNADLGEDFGLRDEEYDPFKNSLVFSKISETDLSTKSPYEVVGKAFAGPLGPLFSSVARGTTLYARATKEGSKPETQSRAMAELETRMAFEAVGNLGLIPFYKDARRILMSDFYARNYNKDEGSSFTITQKQIDQLRKFNPEMARNLQNRLNIQKAEEKKVADFKKKFENKTKSN